MDPPPPYTPLPGSSEASPSPLLYQQPLASQSPLLPSLQLPLRPHPSHTRTASQASIVPVADVTKRRLLIIYIHGFMGNETSFQRFPVHLHNLLCVTLDPLGYIVHTKVYPRFQTRHNILVAAENFSQWLSRFEDDATDVVLIGHSMGGILAADVALLQDHTGKKRHRLLGTISFDSPFLGMHPGVITAGLGSIFYPAAKNPAEEALYQNSGAGSSQSTASLHTVDSAGSQVDEFYSKKPERNFTVVVPKIEGTWNSTLNFIKEHQSNLTHATGQYLMSHLEFGGCLADPVGLWNRYTAIRALEDGVMNPNGRVERVRFLNYYTSSTGRAKPKPAVTAERGFDREVHITPGLELQHDLVGAAPGGSGGYRDIGSGMSQEGSSSGHERSASMSSYNTMSSMGDMRHIPTEPLMDDEYDGEPVALHIVEAGEIPVADGRPPTIFQSNAIEDMINEEGYNEKGLSERGRKQEVYNEKECASQQSIEISRQPTAETDYNINEKIPHFPEEPLSPIPPPPEEPPIFDYSQIPGATVRKVAEKEAAKVWKKYEKSVKEYEKTIHERLAKQRRHIGKEGRRTRDEEKRKGREEKERRREQKEKEKEEKNKEREEQGRLNIKGKGREEREIGRGWGMERGMRGNLRDKRGSRMGGRCYRREGYTQEKQELERLCKEQDDMNSDYHVDGIQEPPQLSPRQVPPTGTPSASSSHSNLPIPPAVPLSKSVSPQPNQKKADHRFCILPCDKNDKCWVKVEMEGVDQVGAHCGLFFVSEVYERLVGDVAAKIEDWVGEEGSMRVAEKVKEMDIKG